MTAANIAIKLKDHEFELNRDEAVELHNILGVLLGLEGINKKYLSDLAKLAEEMNKANKPQHPIFIPQPYPVPVYPRPYWDVVWTSGQPAIVAKSDTKM